MRYKILKCRIVIGLKLLEGYFSQFIHDIEISNGENSRN